MTTDRYVVLGLARARAAWFGQVARWATAAALPVDFIKTVSGEEVRARLRSGRPFSALLVDGGLAALDRDLIELAGRHGCAVIAIDDGRSARSWRDLGVAAVLPADVDRSVLLDALRAVAQPIARCEDAPAPSDAAEPGPTRWRGRSVAVTGSGGVGRSTLAMALAAGLAGDPRDAGLVVLADLALHAQQALLHDAGDVVPGVVELAEAYRGTALDATAVRSMCFSVPGGYDVLLGLRRHRDWTALRPRALAAALDGVRRAYRVVVSDVDPDVEGETECGSLDVEDRNLLARTALRDADVVLVVGLPGVAGVHAHLRVVRELVEFGIAGARIVPVVNRAPRGPRQRAELGAALAGPLLAAACPGVTLASTPIFVPERRRLDDVTRDGAFLPQQIVRPLAVAVRALLDRTPELPTPPAPEPVAVAPGSLGSWSADDTEADEGAGS
jgi:MinD-like ATPase involved in chromosome partitioning or flagellar assembly